MKERSVPRAGVISALRSIFARRVTEPNQRGSNITGLYDISSSGTYVSVDEVLKIPAVLACVRAISETVGMLPFKLLNSFNGSYRTAEWRDEHKLLYDAPNDYQTADAFRQMMTADYLLAGDAFAEKELNLAGRIMFMHRIHPSRVSDVFIDGVGKIRYVVDGKELGRESIFHLPGPTLNGDGIRGDSLVARARDALGLAIGQQQYAAAYYRNGATPATVLIHPKSLKDDTAKRIQASFENNFRGASKAHKFALLEEDMKIQQVGSSAEAAQLVEARREQVIEICRVFRMPPHLVQSLERATFSNIEEQAREFLEYTMMPHFVRWEKNCGQQLLERAERPFYYWKFNADALLRGKTLERYQAYQVAIQNGIYSPNEVRKREDENPYQGGDMHFRPLNMEVINGGK